MQLFFAKNVNSAIILYLFLKISVLIDIKDLLSKC